MNLFQGMEGMRMANGLYWLNEPEKWSFGPQGLVVEAPPSTNFFNDPEIGSIDGTAPFLYAEVKGDFDLTTRVGIKMLKWFDAGCLLIMADETRWAKLCYENWKTGPSIVSVVTRIISDDCPSHIIGEVQPYLRVLRSGSCFGFYYSLDGASWTLIRFFSMEVPEKIKAGVLAQAPIGKSCNVSFEFLRLEAKPVKSAKVLPG
jgi:uncharacterized protein